MTALDPTRHSEGEFYKFYKNLAQEAFLYEAESGSEEAALWIVNCLPKIQWHIKNLQQLVVTVLDCGFTLYNLALDLKGRYGRPFKMKSWRNKSLESYMLHIKKLRNVQCVPTYMYTLANLIELAIYTSTGNMDLACDRVYGPNAGTRWEGVCGVLAALYMYHAALVDIHKSNLKQAKEKLNGAFDALKIYIFEYSMAAAYCYNVLHGKYNSYR